MYGRERVGLGGFEDGGLDVFGQGFGGGLLHLVCGLFDFVAVWHVCGHAS